MGRYIQEPALAAYLEIVCAAHTSKSFLVQCIIEEYHGTEIFCFKSRLDMMNKVQMEVNPNNVSDQKQMQCSHLPLPKI